jgi:archaellum biogenesis ATPase FlaH
MADAAAGTPHGTRWRDAFVDMGTFATVLVAVLGALAGLYIQVHAVEVRVAVVETELKYISATLKELRDEQKQQRAMLQELLQHAKAAREARP